jgi:hypothetical protein
VSAGKKRPEQQHAVLVDVGQPPRAVERGLPVVELAPDAQQLSGRAVTGAEVAVVEQERVDSGGGKSPGKGLIPLATTLLLTAISFLGMREAIAVLG